jgi:leucyl/phenylalanyl-tRNA---protein transferase
MTIYLLSDDLSFPNPNLAGKDGLLAVGGDLSTERLLLAYQNGIFPWFSDEEPIIWWSPDPRLVLYPDELRISRNLKKIIRKKKFSVTMDTAFDEVINACAKVRTMNQKETWITDDMIKAYCSLHISGFAHSVEVWHRGKLAGGLYGVSLGKCFFGESMFTFVDNASKVAFVYLVEFLKSLSMDVIDCQVTTEHMMQFGAREIERKRFLEELTHSLNSPTIRGKWDMATSDVLTNPDNKIK